MNMRIDKARGRDLPQHIPVKALIVVLAAHASVCRLRRIENRFCC